MPAKGNWLEQVEKRTRNGKRRVDSVDPRHFAVDLTIGSIHYKDNPKDVHERWKGIDNIFEPAQAPWDWQMLKAGYHIRVKEDFKSGQVLEFEKQGESVAFQPMALEWTNDFDQIQQISMPQSVAPTITNPEVDLLPAVGMPSHQGTIKWNNGYGGGINFEWKCTSTRLVKILQVNSFDRLPTPEQWIIDGGNPVLRLNLIFDPSSGVDIYVDGELWDKKMKKQTFSVIEFRKDGEVLWGFMPLRYWGSGEGEDNEGRSIATIERRGNSLYISMRVPYEWLKNATYPVFIDTPVDEQVDASTDDAYETESDGLMALTENEVNHRSHTLASSRYWGAHHWSEISIAEDSTINVCYVQLSFAVVYDDANINIHFQKVASPATFSSTAYDITSRTRTTGSTPWVAENVGSGWQQTPSLVAPLQEVVNAYSITAVALIARPNTDADKRLRSTSWDSNPSLAAMLHIEYTAVAPAAGGSSMAAKMMAARVL